MVLVIIIVVAWIVILGPNLLKRRLQGGDGITSISHFHHQLRVLEHSAPPPIVAPAYRLRSIDGNGQEGVGPSPAGPMVAPKLTVVGADQLPRPALAFLGEGEPDSTGAGGGPEPGTRATADVPPVQRTVRTGPPTRPRDLPSRHLARRRRRDTLGVLAVVFLVTFMLGFVPGERPAWIVTLLTGTALTAYVALLVHFRRTAEERERKLHYLEPAGHVAPAGWSDDSPDGVGLPVTVGGRYAHPSNQAAAAH